MLRPPKQQHPTSVSSTLHIHRLSVGTWWEQRTARPRTAGRQLEDAPSSRQSQLDPPMASDILASNTRFLRYGRQWLGTALNSQPPRGQFPGRNRFGLGFGSENKHSEFYRFPRAGCWFPFQLLLNRAFHSEARGLGGSPGQRPQSSRDVYLGGKYDISQTGAC